MRQLIRRPVYPYDAAKGPAVYRGHEWPQPTGPPVHMTLEQADLLPEILPVSQPQLFRKDSIEAIIPPGEIYKDQIIVLREIQDSYPSRPLYFTSQSYPRALGLTKYVAMQGLVAKLFPTPIVAGPRFTEIPGYGFLDLPRSDSLWHEYTAPASLVRHGEWVDRASSDIPLRYVITAALLSDVYRARGDSAKAKGYIDTAIRMARAAARGGRIGLLQGRSRPAPGEH